MTSAPVDSLTIDGLVVGTLEESQGKFAVGLVVDDGLAYLPIVQYGLRVIGEKLTPAVEVRSGSHQFWFAYSAHTRFAYAQRDLS